jgi:hypothetical protein
MQDENSSVLVEHQQGGSQVVRRVLSCEVSGDKSHVGIADVTLHSHVSPLTSHFSPLTSHLASRTFHPSLLTSAPTGGRLGTDLISCEVGPKLRGGSRSVGIMQDDNSSVLVEHSSFVDNDLGAFYAGVLSQVSKCSPQLTTLLPPSQYDLAGQTLHSPSSSP